jgi:chromosome condensin MukBEF MukE localization factor
VRFDYLLPRLRRAGMRAVRAEDSRRLSLAEPIHREGRPVEATEEK